MSYSMDVSNYARPSAVLSRSKPTGDAQIETTNQNPRLIQQQSRSPRTSPVSVFLSGIKGISQRACTWIKQQCSAVEQAVSKFSYDSACRETLLALDMALAGGHGRFSKGQLLNVEKCQERRVAYLERQSSENKKILIKQFNSLLTDRSRVDIETLRDAMLTRGVRETKLIKEGGFKHAAAICSALLNKLPTA